ncbi:MAG: hypothetical protein WC520_01400 [Candidatus Paceibacterota bacterium]
MDQNKYVSFIIIIVVAIIIIAGGYYVFTKNNSGQPGGNNQGGGEQGNLVQYKNSEYGFGVSYLAQPELQYPLKGTLVTGNLQVVPQTADDIVKYDADILVLIPIKNIDQFLQAGQVADFREATLEIRVDDSLSSCTAAGYITQSSNGLNTAPTPNSVNIGGHPFEHIDVSGAGAGNFYNDQVYVGKVNNQCYVVETVVHTVNCGNYDPGKCVTLDKSFVDNQVNAIFSTINFFAPQS